MPTFEENLDRSLKEKQERGVDVNAKELTNSVTEACNNAFPKKGKYAGKKTGVYWWNDEVYKERKKCLAARRELVRSNRRGTDEEKQSNLEHYRELRLALKKTILKAKKESWKLLIDELDHDIWGQGYRILTKKLRKTEAISEDRQMAEAEILFPETKDTKWPTVTLRGITPEFNKDELEEAAQNLKSKKAAGPDAIPPEITKVMARSQEQAYLKIANQAIKVAKFPEEWKTARLVLIEKPKKNKDDQTSYRPICLINTMGKLLEAMLCKRINNEIEINGGLDARQFGFRKGKSTVQAMTEVQNIVTAGTKKRNNRGYCILITIDVKNAFNTVKWQGIIEAMIELGISSYLTEMTADYLQGRNILVGESGVRKMTCGVPQGSKLGPLLWNINYDGVLKVALPTGAALIGFADDLALVVTGWTEEELQLKAECALETTIKWLRGKGLEIAPHKTEAVLLAGRNTLLSMEVKIQDKTIKTKKSVKYLGVYFDKDMRMREHIKEVAAKADRATSQFVKMMPNVDGPRASKRRTLNAAINSMMLYAAPIWCIAMKQQKYSDMLISVQRRMALRICSAYRTISTPAAQVIAGIIPIDLLVEETVITHEQGKENEKEHKKLTRERWQSRWSQLADKAQWTKRMIPKLSPWLDRKHGEVSFNLSQFLSGHGSFQAYLERFHRSLNDKCVYCGERDTAEHTFFACPRWGRSRARLEGALETEVSPENIVNQMLESKKKWDTIATFVNNLMQRKQAEERERQDQERRI